MLYIIEGFPPDNLDALAIQSLVEPIAAVEHGAEKSHINDKGKSARDRVGCIWGSTLDGWTLDDFPDGHQFGNGVSSGARVQINGETRIFSWVCFPAGTTINAAAKKKLRAIMEPVQEVEE